MWEDGDLISLLYAVAYSKDSNLLQKALKYIQDNDYPRDVEGLLEAAGTSRDDDRAYAGAMKLVSLSKRGGVVEGSKSQWLWKVKSIRMKYTKSTNSFEEIIDNLKVVNCASCNARLFPSNVSKAQFLRDISRLGIKDEKRQERGVVAGRISGRPYCKDCLETSSGTTGGGSRRSRHYSETETYRDYGNRKVGYHSPVQENMIRAWEDMEEGKSTCARCKEEWEDTENGMFITCPKCRIPDKPKKKRRAFYENEQYQNPSVSSHGQYRRRRHRSETETDLT